MTQNPLVEVFGSLVALWWIFLMVVAMTIGVAWPLMAFSVMRNIKRIRIEFERLNATLETNVTFTKTGPLGLSHVTPDRDTRAPDLQLRR